MKISPINNISVYQTKKVSNDSSVPSGVNNENRQIKTLSNIYYVPLNFAGDRTYSSVRPELFERPSDFKLVKFDNVPCPACGKKMMTKQKFAEFSERLDKINPEQYLYLLEEYQEYMRPIEASVFQELKALAPSQQTNDIRKLVVALRDRKLPKLQKIQRRKLVQMKKIARGLPEQERSELSTILNELGKQIKRKNEEAPFRRKKMIQEIKDVQISNPHKYEKLQNLAKSFPTSTDTNSAWIVKYSGKNKQNHDWKSKEIAERLLFYSVPNTDHIIPYGTEKGHDDISNYLAMHTGCNTTKSNKPFLQWYNEAPEQRGRNLTAYFNKVQEIIDSDVIENPEYKNYVAYATETIADVSKGQVYLKQSTELDEDIFEDEAELEDDVDDYVIDDENITIAVEQ